MVNMDKYRVTLTEKQIDHLEKVYKHFLAKNQKSTEDFIVTQIYCRIIDQINDSVERSKKRRRKND